MEGLPTPGNIALDGLGQDVVCLIKDCITRCEVSGRMANSRKCGFGGSGSGYGQFDEGLHGEM